MLFFPVLLWGLALGHAQTTDERLRVLSDRIEELERQQTELSLQSAESRPLVRSFLRDDLTLGGFLESGITAYDGPDTGFEMMNDANILGVNFAADFRSRVRFVTQFWVAHGHPLLNEHNNPTATPASLPRRREYGDMAFAAILTQGYMEYVINDHTHFQAGAGYVPFGHYHQQRELVLFVRRGGPQMLRTRHLVAPLWGGLHLLGRYREKRGEWGYNLYTANPTDSSNQMGLGGRLWGATPGDQLVAGVSTQMVRYAGHYDEVLGADLRWQKDRVVVTGEYAQHFTDESDPWSIYAEPGYYVQPEKVLLFVFGDYAHSPLPASGTGADDYQKWEYGVGVNWLPTSFTRLRAAVTVYDYVGGSAVKAGQNRDYFGMDLSAAVAF